MLACLVPGPADPRVFVLGDLSAGERGALGSLNAEAAHSPVTVHLHTARLPRVRAFIDRILAGS